jgi:hypothetical protein
MGSSDGGLILVRELDGRLGLEKLIDEHLWSRRAAGQACPLVLVAADGQIVQ